MHKLRNDISKCIVMCIVIILMGCNEKTISYQKVKKLYKKGYVVKLNGKEINPKFHFLAKDNMVAVRFKDRKQVLITHKDTSSKFANINHLIETFKKGRPTSKSELKIVVIDGIPFMDDELGQISIEISKIKSLDYLTQDELFKNFSHARGDCLIITTK